MSSKVWNLMYAIGSPARIFSNAQNPQTRASAMEGAKKAAANGGRVWVEHHTAGKRIFESTKEKEYQAAVAGASGGHKAPVTDETGRVVTSKPE